MKHPYLAFFFVVLFYILSFGLFYLGYIDKPTNNIPSDFYLGSILMFLLAVSSTTIFFTEG